MNVVLCDQQRLFSEAFAKVLTSHGWNVVSLAADPARAVAAVSSEHVDACLMEVASPDGDTGIAGILALREASPETKVVVLTSSSDPQLIAKAVEAGADAVVFKNDHVDHIIATIERVRNGNLTESPRRPTPSSSTARDTDALGRFLTAREHEVLQHLVDGHGTRQLAQDLNIAYSTARSHIQTSLTKLEVHSRLEAVAYATQHHLCQPSQPAQAMMRTPSDAVADQKNKVEPPAAELQVDTIASAPPIRGGNA